METETTFSHVAPPIFDDDNYQAWAVRMTVHLEALDLWEAIEEDYDETETIKDYSDKLLGIVNKVRLLELVNALQAQEQRRMIRKEESMEGALQAKAENSGGGKDKKNNNKKNNNKTDNNNKNKDGTYPPCLHCKKTNHPQRKCWWRPDVKCRKCGQIGHMERICKSQQHEETKASTEQHQEEQLFGATCFTTSNNSSDSWLIDSGCTNHMTNDQELFKELDKTIISKVKIGNGEFISVKGKGTMVIESLTGLKYITDVLYVPDIDQNLPSVGQLIEKGFKVIFEDKWCMIKDAKGRDVFKVKMRAKSFALNLMEDEQIAFSSTVSNAELWHRRLGHFHHVGLLYMQKQNLVKGVPLLEDKLADCVACQYGKQTRRPFPQTAWRAMHKLQLVQTDVGGPQKTPSLNATWVENQSSCRMQMIRSDNGKEYTNEIFDKFCEKAGIEHQLTAPYTPQQNGVKRDKLDKKAKPGVFIGYSNSSKAYKISNHKMENSYIDDVPIRGIRSLSNVYERNNVVVFEPAEFEEAEKNDKWIEAMKEELRMIKKNDTWELVDRPQHRKELFAPVARLDTIRMLLALTAQKGWKTYQFDVKSAFLNGYLQEEIYVEQPEVFQVKGQEEKVYLLKKALYGLKQAPRPGSNEKLVKEFKFEMLKVFEMTDLGLMSYFLGMEVKQDHDGVFISQKKYAKEILNKFHMEDCKRTSTPMNQKEKFSKDDGAEKVDESQYRSLISCLMYLTATRPDIMFSVSLLSRFMHCASSIDDMRSTTGFCFSFGSGIFSWSSKKQDVIAQSTAKAEYVAANATINQAIWIRKILADLHMKQNEPTQIHVDNQAAIAISNDSVFHGKTKHFKIKLYHLREEQKDGEVKLLYCKTEDQIADVLTKALPKARFETLRSKIGLCNY
ncbi:Copia protein [Vitis vinifera]|uniref:Copia protein n=1 Tax=Vitis vinifera TaxID=29760 RepID=A0A438I566_VITVI|nr:Copia protein [Vitis vinifera]